MSNRIVLAWTAPSPPSKAQPDADKVTSRTTRPFSARAGSGVEIRAGSRVDAACDAAAGCDADPSDPLEPVHPADRAAISTVPATGRTRSVLLLVGFMLGKVARGTFNLLADRLRAPFIVERHFIRERLKGG